MRFFEDGTCDYIPPPLPTVLFFPNPEKYLISGKYGIYSYALGCLLRVRR